MTDVWFYHLEHQSLDVVLPNLLQRSLDRGWRACVEASGPERVRALDEALWTFEESSFLPHGTLADGNPTLQPVLVMDAPENSNGANVRFLIDGADPLAALARSDYERLVVMFDGQDDEAVAQARRHWTTLKNEGHSVTYWQQDVDGRWGKRG